MAVMMPCVICGITMMVRPSVVARKRYCSVACAREGWKGHRRSPGTEFQPGQEGRKQPIGSLRLRYRRREKKQRAWVKAAEGRWKLRAVIVWEETHGPVPRAHLIHHKDGNPLNDDPENLQLVTRAEHLSVHRPEFDDVRLAHASAAAKARWKAYREAKFAANMDRYYWNET